MGIESTSNGYSDVETVSLCDSSDKESGPRIYTASGRTWTSEKNISTTIIKDSPVCKCNQNTTNHNKNFNLNIPTPKCIHRKQNGVYNGHMTLSESLASIYIGSTPSLANTRPYQVKHGVSNNDNTEHQPTSDHQVDTGWSWVILAAYFIMSCTLGFQFGSFSVIYMELVAYFKADRGQIGWIGSLLPATGNFCAIIFGPLVLKLGGRLVTIMGGCIGTVGIGLSSQLSSLPYMYVTYGLIGGIGMASVMMGTLVTLQLYFAKLRALANGIGSVGISVGQLIAGPVARQLVDNRGLQGALLLSAGIFLQNVVVGALLRPVYNSHTTKKKTKQYCDSIYVENVKQVNKHMCKSKQCLSSASEFIRDIFDFRLFKNAKFLMLTTGTFLSVIGCESFFGHYVSRAVFNGIPAKTASILQTVVAFSMIVGRGVTGFLANVQRVNTLTVYGISIVLSGAGAILFVLASDVIGFCIIGVIQGLLIGCFNSIQATVLVDLLGVKVFPHAQGFNAISIGTAFCLSIPLAGILVDISKSYDVPFLVCGSLQLLGGVLLITLAVLHKKHTSAAGTTQHGSQHTEDAVSDQCV